MINYFLLGSGKKGFKRERVYVGERRENENKNPSIILYLKIIKHETIINRPIK